MTKDYYAVLGLAQNAEPVVVRAIFKLMAHRYHPDKWPSEKDQATRMMMDINEAYRHLCKRDNTVSRSTDYYESLGLLSNADAQMIQVAYDALMHQYRLDLARLSSIQQAYHTLSDANKRRVYDKQRKSAFSHHRSDFKLWKVYLAYNVGVYLLMAVIVGLLLLST